MRRALILPLTVFACGAPGPGDFTPPFEQTSMTLATVERGGKSGSMPATITGTETLGGVDVPVITLERTMGGNPAPVDLIGDHEPGRITLGGVRVPPSDVQIGVDLVLDEPLVIPTDGAVGEPVTTTVTGSILLEGATDPGYLPFDVTSTVLDDDATAPSYMGDVPGCARVEVDASSGGISLSGEIWVRDDRGLVHADLETMPFGRFEVGPEAWTGFDDVGSTRVIQHEAILDADHPNFSLSTYDIDGDFLADKNTHAQMWLEVRWADADRARTEEQPPVSETFGTVFGFFPSFIQRSDVSVLHPADADEGFVYWVAFVDQAAKNEAENGIAYRVEAQHTGGDAVHAGAFIRYRRLSP